MHLSNIGKKVLQQPFIKSLELIINFVNKTQISYRQIVTKFMYHIYSNKCPLSIRRPSPINAHPKFEKIL